MKVSVSDGTNSATTNIEFQLLKYPEPPLFPEPSSLTAVMKKSEAVGTIIMTVRADDSEPARTGEISYKIVEDPQDVFEINNTTGVLSLARTLDMKDPSGVLTLRVQATKRTDLGLEGRSSTELSVFYLEAEHTNSGLNLGSNCYCGQKKNVLVVNIEH